METSEQLKAQAEAHKRIAWAKFTNPALRNSVVDYLFHLKRARLLLIESNRDPEEFEQIQMASVSYAGY